LTTLREPVPDLVVLRTQVDEVLRGFLGERLGEVSGGDGGVGLIESAAELVMRGGKRLRAALCLLGWSAAGGIVGDEIVRAACSLELLHGCALIHDDVMDGSATRRGGEAVHRIFAERHEAGGWRGPAERFGNAVAIAAGDLCMVWADRLLRESGLGVGVLERGRAVYDEMRAETIRGQYLDLLMQARGSFEIDEALDTARAKTAASTTKGPLRFGGALAGAGALLAARFDEYGAALGTAFQLRDDVIGAFGDPGESGKPSGDDLRDGKCTALLAEAYLRSDAAGRARLAGLVGAGTDAAVDGLREAIESSGARAAVERRIAQMGELALVALAGMPLVEEGVREPLRALVLMVTDG
jgi:geranylgeranyl diphosphate synthase type I